MRWQQPFAHRAFILWVLLLGVLFGFPRSSAAETCTPTGKHIDANYMFCVLERIKEIVLANDGIKSGNAGEDAMVALALQTFADLGIEAWVEDFSTTDITRDPIEFSLVQGTNPAGGWVSPRLIAQTDGTPAGGVTADVVYVGPGTGEAFAAHAAEIPGKIVLVDSDLAYNAIFTALSFTKSLTLAKRYGAAAVLVSQRSDVGNLPRQVQATPIGGGAFVPGIFPTGVMLSNWEGNLIRDQILAGDSVVAHVVANQAVSEGAISQNVVAWLPGGRDESVIVYGYASGRPNSTLRNNSSVPAVFEIARHYKRVWDQDREEGHENQDELEDLVEDESEHAGHAHAKPDDPALGRKTLYFVLFGSHGTTAGGEAFIAAHQSDILPTASVFGINRIGAEKFRDPLGTGNPLDMGEPENRAAFVTNPTLGDDLFAAFEDHDIPNAIYLPGSEMMIGEGQDFMAACVPTVLIREINIGLGTSAADPDSTILPDLVTPRRMKRDVEAYLDVIDALRKAAPGELRATDASPGCNPAAPSGFIDPVPPSQDDDDNNDASGPEIPGGVVVLNNPGKVSVPAQRKIFPVFAYMNDFRINDESMIIRIDWDFGDGSPITHKPLGAHLYRVAGTYTITATLTDYFGNTTSASTNVTIEP